MDELRGEIDGCDRQIVELLNRRAAAASEIGKLKQKDGKSVFAPEREKAVYEKVVSLSSGPLTAKNLQAIYREVMSACISLEMPTRIAYLGPPGTFSHQAAIQKFGSSMDYYPQPEIRDVFLAVSRGHADYGIVPIENSTEGSVNETNDMLMQTSLKICSEVFLEVHQNLVSNSRMNEIKLVASHHNALAQCRQWLAGNLPGVPVREVPSTALAAERASREPGVAAIASEVAASLYSLSNIVRAIEDIPGNATRFVVLGTAFGGPSGDDRTSVMFSLRHESGSLYGALLPFKSNGINMTRIESRPSKKLNWDYSFLVDIEGHATDPKIEQALKAVQEHTDEFVVLGSYPRAMHLVNTPPPLE